MSVHTNLSSCLRASWPISPFSWYCPLGLEGALQRLRQRFFPTLVPREPCLGWEGWGLNPGPLAFSTTEQQAWPVDKGMRTGDTWHSPLLAWKDGRVGPHDPLAPGRHSRGFPLTQKDTRERELQRGCHHLHRPWLQLQFQIHLGRRGTGKALEVHIHRCQHLTLPLRLLGGRGK